MSVLTSVLGYGLIASNGSVVMKRGFFITRSSVGQYRISYGPEFGIGIGDTIPVGQLVCKVVPDHATLAVIASIDLALSTDEILWIKMRNFATGAFVDCGFFVLIDRVVL